MKDTTKTIIIGILVTILVLALTIFILYKVDSKKSNKQNSSNNEYNNSTPAANMNNTNNSSSNNSENNSGTNTTEIDNTIKDNEKNYKVILYLFHGSTCPACNNAINKIKEARNTTFKNVEIRTFEVWHNEDNSKLMTKVTDKLKVNVNSIPYFLIGEYNRVGFDSEGLLKEYKNALNNKDYKDIIEEVIKENPNLKPVYETI